MDGWDRWCWEKGKGENRKKIERKKDEKMERKIDGSDR